ncbi:MAG: glucosyl-3-phosphoglycerate synthase [Acidimicrobiales bacterium]
MTSADNELPGVPDDGIRVVPVDAVTTEIVAAAKGAMTVAVCLPARDEASTIGAICEEIRSSLMSPAATIVDELVVIDDQSSDSTAAVAADAGARVVSVSDVLAGEGPGRGKGNVLWKSVAATDADLIVFCDADLHSFGPHYITRLVGPLVLDESVQLVKGFYERLLGGQPGEGGRTTELVARPTLSLMFPRLATVQQPLGGEYALRRTAAERLPFVEGYGVDIALLIDTDRRWGTGAIVQVDLGERAHRNRPLHELSVQAAEILHTVLARAGVVDEPGWSRVLIRPGRTPVEIDVSERRPLLDVDEYVAGRPSAAGSRP